MLGWGLGGGAFGCKAGRWAWGRKWWGGGCGRCGRSGGFDGLRARIEVVSYAVLVLMGSRGWTAFAMVEVYRCDGSCTVVLMAHVHLRYRDHHIDIL